MGLVSNVSFLCHWLYMCVLLLHRCIASPKNLDDPFSPRRTEEYTKVATQCLSFSDLWTTRGVVANIEVHGLLFLALIYLKIIL